VHPPKPIYETDKSLEYTETSLDIFTALYLDAVVILAGDLNTLSDLDKVARIALSLTSVINEPTRGRSTLDRIYTSEGGSRATKLLKLSLQ